MSYGGRDNRDGGRDNRDGGKDKRKYHWSPRDTVGAKRFHGSNQPREEFNREGPRWDRGPKPYEQGFSRTNRPPGNSWGNREKNNHNRFPHPPNNRNFNQIFEFQPPVSSEPLRENEELVGPGSDTERMEKVLATKRRIEEALASKSSNSNNKEINFQHSSTSGADKSRDKESHGPSLDLRLTNSDFKEIGSVASSVPVEGEMEPSDLLPNVSSNVSTHTSQQRSFDNTSSNLSPNVPTSQAKTQKVGGWSMSAGSNIVVTNKILPESTQSSSPRLRNDMYLQEQREEILGDVLPPNHENNYGESSISKQAYNDQNYDDEFSRVGRLYQSFLKSRLYGYTLRVRNKSEKPTGPNPLLDKSVLENNTADKLEDQVIELQMPRPRVKLENQTEASTGSTPERIAAEEANEFCKEFSFLLKDPNFLIPSDDLEKLGLSHLSEMNKLISDKRNGGNQPSSVENQNSFVTRNLNAPNHSVRGDLGSNRDPSLSSNFGQGQSGVSFGDQNNLLNNDTLLRGTNSPTVAPNSRPLNFNEPMRTDILRNENIIFAQNTQIPAFQNVSVEAVVEKVVKSILQPTNINSVLNLNAPSTAEANINPLSRSSESNVSTDPGTSASDSTRNTPSNQLQDVSSKILRLFLIDKQVEELMSEKMKIYSELLSSQGVSQTLFHSWAQDQIQQGNVMNVLSNSSNVIPELNRIINNKTKEINPPQPPTVIPENTLDETLTELKELYHSLKKEYVNPSESAIPQTQGPEMGTKQFSNPESQVEELIPCEPTTLPTDNFFLPPKDVIVEEIRPKLSVRKDLLDPERTNINFLNTPVGIPSMSSESNPNSATNPAGTDRTNSKREKKKKKGKKKDSVEIINLIEDTDDEISSTIGAEPNKNDDLSSKVLNSEDEVDKKDNLVMSSKIVYDLDKRTATCMTIMKLKKSAPGVLIVGCKDGYVMGYELGNPVISFTKQIHVDTITSVYYTHKYLITGSCDSSVSLFSLKEQVETQTLSVNGPVQSMDINFGQLIVGTKVGTVYSYTIKIAKEKKKVFVSLHPNKKPLPITNSSILALKLAKEGVRKVLIVASRGEQITVRDSVSGLLLRMFEWCDTVYCLQLYEETPLVYCGTNTKSVKVVNYTDGENAGDCMIGRSITQITFLQSIMFAASYDGNIYVYDIENNKLIATVIISKGIIQCLAVDGKTCVILVASSRGDLQQIPFPISVAKHFRRLKAQKKMNNQNINTMQP